jgi:hypothetical protein
MKTDMSPDGNGILFFKITLSVPIDIGMNSERVILKKRYSGQQDLAPNYL